MLILMHHLDGRMAVVDAQEAEGHLAIASQVIGDDNTAALFITAPSEGWTKRHDIYSAGERIAKNIAPNQLAPTLLAAGLGGWK